MTIKTVSNTTGLLSALKTAQAGDVIQLAAGTYSGVTLKNFSYSGAVTITSADANHHAVLNDLQVQGDNNLIVSNLDFNVDPNGGDTQFQVLSSKNVTLKGISVHGTMNGNPQDDKTGLTIRASDNVSVKNSEFQQLSNGIQSVDSTHVTITGNQIHDIRTDGFHSVGSSNVAVVGNTFHDFDPVAGDHADAMQFWTKGSTASAHDITIKDNIVARGAGDPVQGVFMNDEVGNLPYQNVTIDHNLVLGGLGNGIYVYNGQNVAVTNNTLDSFRDYDSMVKLMYVHGVQVSGNNAVGYYYQGDTSLTQTGNVTNSAVDDGGATALASWSSSSSSGLFQVQTSSVSSSLSVAAPVYAGVTLNGTSGADNLYGLAGADTINGGLGNDYLSGGYGNDTINGGDGSDKIEGGMGADNLTGGLGADFFIFRNADFTGGLTSTMDTITDFSRAQGDKIALNAVDANPTTTARDAFKFIGVQAFHHVVGELRYDTSSGHAIVYGDTNGDGVADFGISLLGVSSLAAGDFYL